MTIIHIVMIDFKPSTDPSTIQNLCNDMLALRSACIHPTTKAPYIRTSSGGRNNSPEAAKADYSHGFVVEFASEADRTYYLQEDPAHAAVVESLAGVVEKVGVLDYAPGVM